MPWCHRKLQLSHNKAFFGHRSDQSEHRNTDREFPGNDNKNPHTADRNTKNRPDTAVQGYISWDFFSRLDNSGWDRSRSFDVIQYWCSGTSISICVVLMKQRYFVSSLHIFPLWTDSSFANLRVVWHNHGTCVHVAQILCTLSHRESSHLVEMKAPHKTREGFKGSLPGLMKTMWVIRYGLHTSPVSTQQSTDTSDSTLHHHLHDREWLKKGVQSLQ